MTDDSPLLCFEIPVEEQNKTPKRAPPDRLSSKNSNKSLTEQDLNEKLASAEKRRLSALEVTNFYRLIFKAKREQIRLNAVTVQKRFESASEKEAERSMELMSDILTDMAIKDKKHAEQLEKKIKVAQVKSLKPLVELKHCIEAEKKLKTLEKDMADKENNRDAYLSNIKEKCQSQINKVEQVRNRRSTTNSSMNKSNAD